MDLIHGGVDFDLLILNVPKYFVLYFFPFSFVSMFIQTCMAISVETHYMLFISQVR